MVYEGQEHVSLQSEPWFQLLPASSKLGRVVLHILATLSLRFLSEKWRK